MSSEELLDNSGTILEDEFTLRSESYRVGLTKNSIRLSSDSYVRLIPLEDVIGSTVEVSYQSDDQSAFLLLDTCQRIPSEKNRRQSSIRLASSNGVSKARNLELVRKWDRRLRLLVRNVNYYENKEKPFLVFVNPNSGSGKAGDIFLKHTANIWNKAHVSFEAVTTEYKNHAREMIISKDLSKYRGVIVVSGDGLIHEVINGLLMRPDWRKSIQLPIGQIPAGSANGLASTAAYISGEQFQANRLELFASRMAFFFTKFKPNPIDLVSIQLFDGSFLNSFMNVEWAIVADVDSESEQFRFLGGLRFLVQFLIRIINLRVYRGRISFLPAESGIGAIKLKNKNISLQTNTNNYSEEENKSRLVNTDLGLTYRHLKSIDQPVPNDWLTIEDNFILFILVNLPLVGMDFLISPDKKIDDDHLVMIFVREGITKFEMLKFIAQCSQGTMLKNPYVETIKVKAFRLEPLDPKYGSLMVDGEPVCYGPIQGEVLPRAANIFANPTQTDV